MAIPTSLTTGLAAQLRTAIADNGGWIGFDTFMQRALYTPGLGYYARGNQLFGNLPAPGDGRGGDFTTAPEMSPYFGRALAVQVGEALQATGTDEVWEFGAGSGALAVQLLDVFGPRVRRYTIVDVSGALRAQQQQRLAEFGERVHWVSELPEQLDGVVVGNEVLDAMPVKLLVRIGGAWHERGVAASADGAFCWSDRTTDLRPPVEIAGEHDYLTEIHLQAQGFMRTLVDRLVRGAVILIDYGFPEQEYYHPQRATGTVMCHRGHRADGDPLADVGDKDITAHVDFSAVALAAQQAADEAAPGGGAAPGPWQLLGYTSQARFLVNCGLPQLLAEASLAERTMAQKLMLEHEMGELFKVIMFCRGDAWDAVGFSFGDRSHTL